MKISSILDNNTDFELVVLKTDGAGIVPTPHCKKHGAMNKVSVFKGTTSGYWRCLTTESTTCRAGCVQEAESINNE